MKKLVLILNNEKRKFRLIVNMLDIKDYDCLQLTPDEEIFTVIKENSPDVIILDYESKLYDNSRLLEFLKLNGYMPNTSIILLTDKQDYNIPDECKKYAISDFIPIHNISENMLNILVKNSLEKVNYKTKIFELSYILNANSDNDAVTGLINKKSIYKQLENEINRADRDLEVLSVVLISIDFYTTINNIYSQIKADKAFKEIGDLLVSSVRKTDIVGKFAYDEFIIIFINKKNTKSYDDLYDNIVKKCKMIHSKITQYKFALKDDTEKTNLPIYMGVAFYTNRFTLKEFIEKADNALSYAKTHGDGNMALYLGYEEYSLIKD